MIRLIEIAPGIGLYVEGRKGLMNWIRFLTGFSRLVIFEYMFRY